MQDVEGRSGREHGEAALWDRHNRAVFDDSRVAEHYAAMPDMYLGEDRAFALVAAVSRNRPILDLGVGGGRTTPKLLALSSDYVGVDYAPAMVDECRRRFPNLDFRVADGRDLTFLPASHFGLVLFSFNGLDTVPHRDRLTILRQVRRLLVPGAAFVFSSHNADYDRRRHRSLLRRLLGKAQDYVVTSRHLGFPRRFDRRYSYRAERAINGKRLLIHYYISKENQVAQLAETGFRCEAIFDTRGERAVLGTPEADPAPWLYYVARAEALPD